MYIAIITTSLLIIWAVITEIRLYRLKKELKLFIPEGSNKSFTDILSEYVRKAEKLGKKIEFLEKNQLDIKRETLEALRYVGIVRYNAFSDIGGETSFSLGLLNAGGDGVVISSLQSRKDVRVYVKPVVNGESPRKLSEEEEMAIKKALQKPK
jgi:hypothetical protein